MKIIRLLLVTIVAMGFGLNTLADSKAVPAAPKFTQDQVKAIQGIVHDYLVKNPQVLVEASQALQAQQEKQMESAAVNAIKANKKALFDNPNSPSVGKKDAAVTLVEFFDYQCGHCRAMADIIEKITDNDKNLRVVFKELPIFGGNSKLASEAALAAMQQDKYYAFHNALFQASGPLSEFVIMKLAKKSGLDVKKLKADMKSAAVQAEIKANFTLAKSLKIMGTPTFVLANKDQTKFKFMPGATTKENLVKQIKALE